MGRAEAEQLAGVIDHTLLRPDATAEAVRRLCLEARSFGFASVCVNPFYTAAVRSLLAGSGVKTCAVIGFPLGAALPYAKAAEADGVLDAGAQEVDMVINIGALKDRRDLFVRGEIRDVAVRCNAAGALLKVILETGLLTDEEKRRACRLCVEAGAGFVKTSTGFGGGGATAEDVRLMADAVREAGLGVKASGGIRTLGAVRALLAAGATRIGTSAGPALVAEAAAAPDGYGLY